MNEQLITLMSREEELHTKIQKLKQVQLQRSNMTIGSAFDNGRYKNSSTPICEFSRTMLQPSIERRVGNSSLGMMGFGISKTAGSQEMLIDLEDAQQDSEQGQTFLTQAILPSLKHVPLFRETPDKKSKHVIENQSSQKNDVQMEDVEDGEILEEEDTSMQRPAVDNSVPDISPLRHGNTNDQSENRVYSEYKRHKRFPDSYFGPGMLGFCPPSSINNVCRTVMFHNIPLGTSVADVTAKIRGGLIVSIELLNAGKTRSRSVRSMTARVVFFTEASASRYCNFRETYPLLLGNELIEILHLKTATWPMENLVAAAILNNRHTRCLSVQHFPAHLSFSHLYTELGYIECSHKIAIESIWEVGGEIRINFTSIAAANAAYEKLNEYPIFEPCQAMFVTDPCARSLAAVDYVMVNGDGLTSSDESPASTQGSQVDEDSESCNENAPRQLRPLRRLPAMTYPDKYRPVGAYALSIDVMLREKRLPELEYVDEPANPSDVSKHDHLSPSFRRGRPVDYGDLCEASTITGSRKRNDSDSPPRQKRSKLEGRLTPPRLEDFSLQKLINNFTSVPAKAATEVRALQNAIPPEAVQHAVPVNPYWGPRQPHSEADADRDIRVLSEGIARTRLTHATSCEDQDTMELDY